MPCGCEGNRRAGVALAMRHRLRWFIHLRAHGLDREMSTPRSRLRSLMKCGPFTIYLLEFRISKENDFIFFRIGRLILPYDMFSEYFCTKSRYATTLQISPAIFA